MKTNILFLCTGNSCRSQMAEAWLRHLKPDKFNGFSAGIENHGLNQQAVQVMAEAGIDISNHKSKNLADLAQQDFDYVFTVCGHAQENCPYFSGSAKLIHVGFDDPPKLAALLTTQSEKMACYRRVRDEIRQFIEHIETYLT